MRDRKDRRIVDEGSGRMIVEAPSLDEASFDSFFSFLSPVAICEIGGEMGGLWRRRCVCVDRIAGKGEEGEETRKGGGEGSRLGAVYVVCD